MEQIINKDNAWRAPVLFAIHIVILFVISIIGHILRPGLSMLLFYIMVTVSASWFIGKRWGVAASLTAAAAELTVRLVAGPWPTGAFVPAWNFTATLLANILIAYLTEYTRIHLKAELELIRKDFLTGIYNLRAFYEEGTLELERCRRNGVPLTIMYMDIDNLESLNYTLSRRAGNHALQSIAAAIKNSIRITDILARTGDDEFTVLLPGGNFNQASSAISRVLTVVKDVLADKKWHISVTTAAITYLSIPPSVDHMIKEAEESMKIAKVSADHNIRHTVVSKLQLVMGKKNQKQDF